MKRILFVVLSVCLLAGLLAVSASAETVTSGVCGDNLTWEMSDYTLTISGTGPMYDYELGGAPWYEFEKIDKVFIKHGVTSIGNYAFARTNHYRKYELPASIKIGRASCRERV